MRILARHPARHADDGDVVGGHERAAADAGPGAHLGRRGRSRSTSTAWCATPTSSSSRFPRRPRRSWRRRCSSAVCESSISRAPSASGVRADRQRWYPATAALPDGTVYGMTEGHQAEPSGRRAWSPIRAAIRPRRCSRSSRWRAAGLLDGPVFVDAKSGVSGAGKTPSERTHFSENHGSVAAYAVFSASAHRGDRAGARRARSRSCRTSCRSTAASSRRSTAR